MSPNSNSLSTEWYCVRSTVGYEIRAAELLARLSPETVLSTGEIEVYCPLIRKSMSVAGKKRLVTGSLFPGYFFARFNLTTASRYVSSRPGIIGLVRFGDRPTPVADSVIDELKETDFEALAESLSSFTPGQTLVIQDGPFAGMEAQFVTKMNDGHRALLLLEYLNRQVSVVVDSSSLEAAA